jgi:hypothetical protein
MVCLTLQSQKRRPALDAGLGFVAAPSLKKSRSPHQVRADEGEIFYGS